MRELLALTRELKARLEVPCADRWRTAPMGARSLEGGRSPLPEGAAPAEAPAPAPAAEKAAALAALRAEVEACRRCPLGSQRLHPAFGTGSPDAAVLFIGEGPGFEEDRRAEPFVGRAGQLLDKILAAISLSRLGTTAADGAYIANVVKCHPMKDPSDPEKRGNDRPPTAPEMEACRGYLDEQIRIVRPRFLVALGGTAAKALLGTQEGISRLRGRWQEYRSIPLLPTYHPAALLRDPGLKRDVWNDMKMLRDRL